MSIERKEIEQDNWLTIAGSAREKINSKITEVEDIKRVEEILKPAFDRTKSFRKRLKEFIKAENDLGRTLGIAVDIWGFFNPRVRTVEDYIRKHIIPKL